MIWYMATQEHAYTIQIYLQTWGKPLAGRFGVAPYELWLGPKEFEPVPGTYIFTDMDRLTPAGLSLAACAWERISDLGGEARILNHPTQSLGRYDLLRALFERGDNRFNVYRLAECPQPRRWPVFIREEYEHTKNLTELLHSPEALDAGISEVLARDFGHGDELMVEFCDTKDDQGLFYKYGAYLIGERVIPSHLFASRNWMVTEENSLSTPEALEKERRYMETNPHERELREIFRLARIDYGRIDYSMLGDRLQVWEINTNPLILSAGNPYDTKRKAVFDQCAKRLAAAFAEIDSGAASHEARPRVTFLL